MKFIEEYIRNLLGREAPPSLDADDLWASIDAGLPQEDDPVAVTPASNRRGIAGLVLLLLMLGGGVSWLLVPDAERSVKKGAFTEEPDLDSTNINSVAKDNLTVKKSQAEQRPSPALTLGAASRSTSTAPAAAASDLYRENHLNAVVENSSADADVAPATSEPSPLSPGPPKAAAELTGVGEKVKILLLPSASTERITFNPTLPPFPLAPGFSKLKRRPPLSLGLHAGGNFRFQRFASSGGDAGNSLNQASGLATGQTAAIDLRYRINNHFSVGAGVEYHRTTNTFRHTLERDTLVPHPTPPNTGLIEGIVRHSVAHNNRSQLLSVPVLMAYERRFGDFSLSLAAGLSANYELSATGRSLAAPGNFIRYDEPVYDRLFLAYHLRPELAWRPKATSSWTVEFRADVRYFDLGASTTTGATQTGWLITPTLGVRRSINE